MRSQLSQSLMAASAIALLSTPAYAYKLKSGETDLGDLTGKIQIHSVLDGEDNGYDPNEGDSYLLKLKYESPSYKGFKIGLGSYTNGDLFNSTDFSIPNSSTTDRIARGMFVTPDGNSKTLIGEAYINYKSEKFSATAGNQMFKSPLTTIAYSQMPNFYTVFGAKTTAIPDLSLGVYQISEMAFGSRAITDWALIGEGTNSAGAAVNPSVVKQAEFHSIATVSGASEDTDGMMAFNASYSGFKGVNVDFWHYRVDDIANNLYLQADTTIPVSQYKLDLSGQYLHQSDAGSSLAGERDFDMLGLQATLKGKGWAIFGAYNHSEGDTAMLNAWGGDPAFTSSIFSRNAYREDVDAFKIGFKYKLMKDLTFVASHANYGQSNTITSAIPKIGGTNNLAPANDAKETDLVLIYKPSKDWMIKAFHAIRTSEYDDATSRDLTQAHTRLIASFEF